LKFRGTWAKRDPKEPHWHLDPLGVSPEVQGQGIGSRLMEFYCDYIDKLGAAAYHETDRPENVRFYERFGYQVIGEEIILDFQNWYFWRPATPLAAAHSQEGEDKPQLVEV
jgi:GNAT superfamily N-acetyltransferase